MSPVYSNSGASNGAGGPTVTRYGATICVPKKQLYAAVKELRKVGLVSDFVCGPSI